MGILWILFVMLLVCIFLLAGNTSKSGRIILVFLSLALIVICFPLILLSPTNGIPLQDKPPGEYEVLGVMTVEGIDPEEPSVVVLLQGNKSRYSYTVKIKKANIEGEILTDADRLEIWKSGDRKMYRFR